jgi:hypothetical protein
VLLDHLRVEQLSQLRLPEKLAQPVEVDGQRLGAS